MEFRAGDDVVTPTPTSHFPAAEDGNNADNGHTLPFPIRTGFSNNPNEHFPSRQDEDDDDDDEEFQRPLVVAETYRQESESNGCLHECMSACCCCLFFTLPLITVFSLFSFLFSVLPMETTFKLGPRASVLIDEYPNPLTKEFVRVERIYDETREPEIPNGLYDDTPLLNIVTNLPSSPMLFGFDKPPPLNIETSWSDNHNATLHGYARKVDWKYYLNKGSKIDISYNVSSLIPAEVYLVIREAGEFSYSRNLLEIPINGTGEIGRNISISSKYSISLYNTRLDIVEVELEIKIKGLVYDYSKASYNCSINHGPCFMRIPLTGANSALLAFPDPGNGKDDEAHLVVSYESRWIMWLILIVGPVVAMAILITVVCPSSNRSHHIREGESIPMANITCRAVQGESSFQENIEPQGESLIPQKDDTVASSNGSGNPDEDGPSTGSNNGNVTSDSNNKRICAICFNAPRDCLFLPCGHSVSCYACGIKIAKVTGICIICRRHMKVKRIYTV